MATGLDSKKSSRIATQNLVHRLAGQGRQGLARLLDRLDKALDVRAQVLLPVHWATFNLGLHDWDEPIRRTLKTAQDHKVELVTPRLGELFDIGQAFPSSAWWEQVK
jgi:L-ascorbate metabolism protein UlaG (beta-lactamase superfamily)